MEVISTDEIHNHQDVDRRTGRFRWRRAPDSEPGRVSQALGSTIVISPSIIFPVKVNFGPKMA